MHEVSPCTNGTHKLSLGRAGLGELLCPNTRLEQQDEIARHGKVLARPRERPHGSIPAPKFLLKNRRECLLAWCTKHQIARILPPLRTQVAPMQEDRKEKRKQP